MPDIIVDESTYALLTYFGVKAGTRYPGGRRSVIVSASVLKLASKASKWSAEPVDVVLRRVLVPLLTSRPTAGT